MGHPGAAHYRTGDLRSAIAELEKAHALRKADDPGKALDGFFLAMAYGKNGEREKAIDWFNKAKAWAAEKKDDAEMKRSAPRRKSCWKSTRSRTSRLMSAEAAGGEKPPSNAPTGPASAVRRSAPGTMFV